MIRADDAQSVSDSEASLATLTPSMSEELFQVNDTGSRFSALNDCLLPFDDPEKQAERKIARFISALADDPSALWLEHRKGLVDKVINATAEPRELDIGCGIEGVWVSDVGSRYPEAEVIGLDLIGVEVPYLPPNVSAEIWDVTQGLPFPDGYFHLVHIRATLYWRSKEYQHLMTVEARRVLASGGVLIIEEKDTSIRSDLPVLPWAHLQPKGETKLDTVVYGQLETMLAECPEDPSDPSSGLLAFSEVHEREFDVHLGWREGKEGQPPSTRLGDHPACELMREVYSTYTNIQRVPEKIGGVPSQRELLLREISRCLSERSDTGYYIGVKCLLAVRA